MLLLYLGVKRLSWLYACRFQYHTTGCRASEIFGVQGQRFRILGV